MGVPVPVPTALRFPHAPDAEPNARQTALFILALGRIERGETVLDAGQLRQMLRMAAGYRRRAQGGPAADDRWEDGFRELFPQYSWRLASPPRNFPPAALRQWRALCRSLSFSERSRLGFALFIAPVLEATLARFGIAALRNPRLQVDTFADGAFDLAAHIDRLLGALRERIGRDPYPAQVRSDRRMIQLLRRFAALCGFRRGSEPSEPA